MGEARNPPTTAKPAKDLGGMLMEDEEGNEDVDVEVGEEEEENEEEF